MNITEESRKLMSFFVEHECLIPIKQTNKTRAIFKNIYNEIHSGVSYIQNIKAKMGNMFYRLKIEPINNVHQIPKPKTFSPNDFPSEIIHHIDKYSMSSYTYSFNLFDRNINIYFLSENVNPEKMIGTYNSYAEYMLVWLYIVNKYASKQCSPQLKIFVYHTNLLKTLPKTNVEVLDTIHVNTAFTSTCPKNSEIVVFRKEEWFKVFIHETFHNFGLDFSGMDVTSCKKKILSIFPINSDIALYESYTEFWARLMNALFCGYISMNDKTNVAEFISNSELFINFEYAFSIFQMVKILNFMGLTYTMLYDNNIYTDKIRKTLYKENTNVLAYYIITAIMFTNYQDFLIWCTTNNKSLLQFKKTRVNLDKFCYFIEDKYKTKNVLNGVICVEQFLLKLSKHKTKNTMYLLRNLRMTICELG
jgi:hypothetical protein